MNDFSLISGRHAIEEALDSHQPIEKIFLARSVKGPFEKFLRQTARERIIPLAYVEKAKLDKLSRSNHQGVIAYVTPLHYYSDEVLIPHLMEKIGAPLLVLVDGVTDVRNIGAIARSCEVLGASALVIPTDRSALMNEFAIKSSAGALLRIPVCRTHSLINTADYLTQSGFTLVGLDGSGELAIDQLEHPGGPMAIIMGDEEKGIRRPLMERCHHILRIPQYGGTESLNVSVAAGIAIYELNRIMKKTK